MISADLSPQSCCCLEVFLLLSVSLLTFSTFSVRFSLFDDLCDSFQSKYKEEGKKEASFSLYSILAQTPETQRAREASELQSEVVRKYMYLLVDLGVKGHSCLFC